METLQTANLCNSDFPEPEGGSLHQYQKTPQRPQKTCSMTVDAAKQWLWLCLLDSYQELV